MTHIPTPGRPHMAASYGLPEGLEGTLSWDWVTGKMQQSRNYWISSVTPQGQPHAAPVWGVWLEDALYFGVDRQSRKGRNLMMNPAVVAHLESGDDVVIVAGRVAEVTDAALRQRVSAAYHHKYFPDAPQTDVIGDNLLLVVQAHKVLAWLEYDFPRTATRYRFDTARPQP